jgi:hypothetical protein
LFLVSLPLSRERLEARLGVILAGHSPAGGRGRGQAVFAVFVEGSAGRAVSAAGKAVIKSGLKSAKRIYDRVR